MSRLLCIAAAGAAACHLFVGLVQAEKFTLVTGLDARHYPGADRSVNPDPGPGFAGVFNDGDRLAGTSDVGPVVPYVGLAPDPIFDPNEFGSLSMLYRRGSVPLGPSGVLPFMGIEFLGGPLLDLDGDLENGVRSLIPVSGATPALIPGSASTLELEFVKSEGAIRLLNIDVTGNNEGGPGIGPDIATILVTIAGTNSDGSPGSPPNPDWDTRLGRLTAFEGRNGRLTSVYRIEDLSFEIWEDSIDPNSGSADVLGTMQFLGVLQGWLIERDEKSGKFPRLAAEGLGSTLWPLVETAQVGQSFNTANGLAGGTATIRDGVSKDKFSVSGNGGIALSDFDGDLGAYLDEVVVPLLSAEVQRFVYLESAGFGINNSNDPVFGDTVGYDVVLIAAAEECASGARCDANCDGSVDFNDIDCFVAALLGEDNWLACGLAGEGCDYRCANDTDGNGSVDFNDIDAFVECLTR